MVKLTVAPGVFLWREKFSPVEQKALLDDVLARLEEAPLYRPVMPGTAKPFSVEESNFGALGWVADKAGYRYQPIHPLTAKSWPAIPEALLALWAGINDGAPPECCLVNLYRPGAKMGLHQDRDETEFAAPVISISLGDTCLFRVGGCKRNEPTRSVRLSSGDVVVLGGASRLAFHGVDRILPGTSRLLPEGGRINLTLRRVTRSDPDPRMDQIPSA